MFGASGYVVPTSNHQHMFSPAHYKQPSLASPFVDALGSQQQCTSSYDKVKAIVDVSMDLLQYMSDGLGMMACGNNDTATACCPPDTYPSLGSGCSSQCNQMEPDSPTYKQHTQQSPSSSSSSAGCHTTDASPSPATSSPSSSSSSSSGADLEQPKASSAPAYDDDFVFQCYYGDPNSSANRQQQRPKQASPFAAFSTFPGFS